MNTKYSQVEARSGRRILPIVGHIVRSLRLCSKLRLLFQAVGGIWWRKSIGSRVVISGTGKLNVHEQTSGTAKRAMTVPSAMTRNLKIREQRRHPKKSIGIAVEFSDTIQTTESSREMMFLTGDLLQLPCCISDAIHRWNDGQCMHNQDHT